MAGPPNAPDPLVEAARAGDVALVETLLKKRGGDVDVTLDFAGRTPLCYAAEAGQLGVVSRLLALGAAPGAADLNGRTPLFAAVGGGDMAVVQALLDAGADASAADEDERSAVSYAAQHGRTQMLRLLLDAGAEPDAEDAASRTPLSYAAEAGCEEAVSALLSAGAAVNRLDAYSRTPLAYACRGGHMGAAAALLSGGGRTDVHDNDGRTCFSHALSSGSMDLVKLVCSEGESVNASETFDGKTPLFLAAQSGNLDLMHVLLDNGAEVNRADGAGRTPLHASVASCMTDVASLLLMKGADVDAVSHDGCTPLMEACREGNTGLVRLLLEAGADVQLRDEEGRSPVDVASCDEARRAVEERYMSDVLCLNRYEPARMPPTPAGSRPLHPPLGADVGSISNGTALPVTPMTPRNTGSATPSTVAAARGGGYLNSTGAVVGGGAGTGEASAAAGAHGVAAVGGGGQGRSVLEQAATDLVTGDGVVLRMFSDQQRHAAALDVLKGLSQARCGSFERLASVASAAAPQPPPCTASLFSLFSRGSSSSSSFGSDPYRGGSSPSPSYSSDPFLASSFSDARRFPSTPHVVVVEAGEATLEQLAAVPLAYCGEGAGGAGEWRRPSRVELVAASVAGSLAALQERGLVHTDLGPHCVTRHFDGSLRLGGSHHMHRAGATAVELHTSWQACPPEYAAALLAGEAKVQEVDGSIQMWQLGCLLYLVATGRQLSSDLIGGQEAGLFGSSVRDRGLRALVALAEDKASAQAKLDSLISALEHGDGSDAPEAAAAAAAGRVAGAGCASPPGAARLRLVTDLLRTLLLRVEPGQRSGLEEVLNHPLLQGSVARSVLDGWSHAGDSAAAPGGTPTQRYGPGLWGRLHRMLDAAWAQGVLFYASLLLVGPIDLLVRGVCSLGGGGSSSSSRGGGCVVTPANGNVVSRSKKTK